MNIKFFFAFMAMLHPVYWPAEFFQVSILMQDGYVAGW